MDTIVAKPQLSKSIRSYGLSVLQQLEKLETHLSVREAHMVFYMVVALLYVWLPPIHENNGNMNRNSRLYFLTETEEN